MRTSLWCLSFAETQHFGRRPGQQHNRQRFFNSIRWTKAQPVTMTSKSPNKHWKAFDWKSRGQLRTLEKEEADVLELLSRHLTELEVYLTKKKTVAAERAYRCFFEVHYKLEHNRLQHQGLLLKPKFFENFENDTKRMLD